MVARKSNSDRLHADGKRHFEASIRTLSTDFEALLQTVEVNAKFLKESDLRKGFAFIDRVVQAARDKAMIAVQNAVVGRAFSLDDEELPAASIRESQTIIGSPTLLAPVRSARSAPDRAKAVSEDILSKLKPGIVPVINGAGEIEGRLAGQQGNTEILPPVVTDTVPRKTGMIGPDDGFMEDDE